MTSSRPAAVVPPEPGNLLDPVAVAKGEALGVTARSIIEGYRVGGPCSKTLSQNLVFRQDHRGW